MPACVLPRNYSETIGIIFQYCRKNIRRELYQEATIFFRNFPKPTRYLQDLSDARVTEWNFIPYTDFFSVGCFQQVLMPLAPRTHKFQYTEQIPSC